jgi:hemerythrin-like domain-containing protein
MIMTVTTRPQVLLPGQLAAPEGPVDLTNMYVMHHAFRRDLRDFRTTVADARLGDHDRWRALLQRWRMFGHALHSHHTAEDEGLWPMLLERVAADGDDGARTVLEAMQAEHARIGPVLEECEEGFVRQANGPTEAVRSALEHSLAGAHELLSGHLGHEERAAMVLVQRYLVEADWQYIEQHHFRPAYAPRDILWVVAWTAIGLPVEVHRRALASGGLPMKIVWWLTRRRFRRAQAAVFGRRQPAPEHVG